MMDSNSRISDLLNDPATSDWLRTALASGLDRDPIDAAADAEVLAAVLADRAEAALRLQL